jgi:hypothetical protein
MIGERLWEKMYFSAIIYIIIQIINKYQQHLEGNTYNTFNHNAYHTIKQTITIHIISSHSGTQFTVRTQPTIGLKIFT